MDGPPCRPAVRLQELDQLRAPRHREGRGDADCWSCPSSLYSPSSSEPIRVPGPFLCQRKPATTQSAVRGCLILAIVRLPGAYGSSARLAMTPSRPAPSKTSNQWRATARIGRRRREPDRRVVASRRDRSSRARRSPNGALAQVVVGRRPGSRRRRMTAGAASASILTRDAAGWMRSSSESKSSAAVRASDDDLAVEHESRLRAAERTQRLLQLGEVAIQRLEVARLDEELVAIAEDERAEAVPLRLVDPAVAGRDGGGGLGQHRLDRRLDREPHAPMIRRRHGIIGRMRDPRPAGAHRSRGPDRGGAMAVGYSFICRWRRHGTRCGDRHRRGAGTGTRRRRPSSTTDTPVFVVNDLDGDACNVVDARAPVHREPLPVLVAWCPMRSAPSTPVRVRSDGDRTATAWASTPTAGLRAFRVTRAHPLRDPRDGREVVILSSSARAGGRIDAAPDCLRGAEWVIHRPAEGEVFDPSVAVDAEPLGWHLARGRHSAASAKQAGCATRATRTRERAPRERSLEASILRPLRRRGARRPLHRSRAG